MVIKACARCQTQIEAIGNRRFCPPCRKDHDREYARIKSSLERKLKPELNQARQQRYRETHREESHRRSRAYAAANTEARRAVRDLIRFGGVGMLALQRDAYLCRLCGTGNEPGKRSITIHHIDGTKDNNTIGNLITLCRRCHPTVHNKWHGATRQEDLRALVN